MAYYLLALKHTGLRKKGAAGKFISLLVYFNFLVDAVERRALVRRYKVLLNVKILYSITLYFRFRFAYRLILVDFY